MVCICVHHHLVGICFVHFFPNHQTASQIYPQEPPPFFVLFGKMVVLKLDHFPPSMGSIMAWGNLIKATTFFVFCCFVVSFLLHPLKTNMTGWKIPMLNRKYIFKMVDFPLSY